MGDRAAQSQPASAKMMNREPNTLMALRRTLLLLFLLLFAPALLHAQDSVDNPSAGPLPVPAVKPINNDSVVRMVKAGLSDDLIIDTIRNHPGQFATDPDALVALKQADVSDHVIAAMVNKSRIQITGAAASSQPAPIVLSDVNEIGVYYKDRAGKWQPIDSEVVHIKSGGFIKSTVTDGIIKQDRNGHVNGRESKLLLPRPIDFLIYTAEGVEGDDYQLIRFRLNSDNREFRAWTGGVFHSSSGADRDQVAFKPKKTAPRAYQFTVGPDTPGGEYGILPPGTGNLTNGGKIYTFAISE
jgi:hypothetical protein